MSALPAPVGALLAALDAGDAIGAGAACAADAWIGLAPSGDDETAPRAVGRRSDLAALLAGAEPGASRSVVTCIGSGSFVFIEGTQSSARRSSPGTFAASVRLSADGLVERYVQYGCTSLVGHSPAEATGPSAHSAARVVDRYFHLLDAGEFDAAAACFSDAVLYSHPPYRHTGITDPGRAEFVGRADLAAAFHRRGRQAFSHEIVASEQRGPWCIFEGIVPGLPGGRTGGFVSSLTLDADGLIARYVSFFAEPAVPLR